MPEEVYENYRAIAQQKTKAYDAWNALFAEYCEKYPEMKALWDRYHDENAADDLIDNEEFWAFEDKPDATRNLSGKMINRIKDLLPNLIGGSADRAPSNKTHMDGETDFSKDN